MRGVCVSAGASQPRIVCPVASHGRNRILDNRALLFFRHVIGVAGVVNAVAEELPAARDAIGDDLRMMLA